MTRIFSAARCGVLVLLSLTGFCAVSKADTAFYVDSAWGGSQTGAKATPWKYLSSTAWGAINASLQTNNTTIYFSARAASSQVDGLYDANGDGVQDGVDITKRTAATQYLLTFDGTSYYNSSETSPNWTSNTSSSMCKVQYLDAQNDGHLKYSNIRINGFRIVRNTGGKLVSICGDNWTVENCDMSHTSTATDGPGLYLVPAADSAHEGSSAYAPPCSNIIIRNNKVHDTFGEALYMGGGGANPGQAGSGYPAHSHILIESNTIYRASVWGGQGDGIDVKGGLDFLTIRGNEIYNLSSFSSGNDVRGIVMQGQYQQPSGQVRIVEKNIIHDCAGLEDSAIAVVNNWGIPQGVTLRNNLIYNISANSGTPDGIKVYGSQDTVGIFDNTIYNCAGSGIEVQSSATAVLTNNLVVGNHSGSYQLDASSGTVKSDYNAFSSPWGWSSEGPHSLTLSSTDIANTFVNPSAGDFHLKATAPVLGKGAVVNGFVDDIFGTSRGSTWDIGAFEFGAGGGTTGTPAIEVTPSSLSFGTVAVGSDGSHTFSVQNTGSGTLSGTASVPAPFSIVSGGSYALAGGQSQTVTVRYTPTTPGASDNQTVTFTGATGASRNVSGTAAGSGPTISSITQTGADVDTGKSGLQVFAGSVVQYSATASDPNGLTVNWQWSYSVNGGAETIMQSGVGTVSSVSYNYTAATAGNTYTWKLRAWDTSETNESDLVIGVEAAPTGNSLTFQAASATLTSPMALANGSVSQAVQTTVVSNAGTAVFSFGISNAGAYVIQALVNAPSTGKNSFYLNIDAAPQDPTMIWDIPLTAGFEQRVVSWRGNGSDVANQFVPKVFNLTSGTHQLIVCGREADVQLQSLSLLLLPTPPSLILMGTSPISRGQATSLSWRCSGATNLTITGIGNVPLSGSTNIAPSSTTTYTATAKGSTGIKTSSLTVVVQ